MRARSARKQAERMRRARIVWNATLSAFLFDGSCKLFELLLRSFSRITTPSRGTVFFVAGEGIAWFFFGGGGVGCSQLRASLDFADFVE